jgi:pimeloyl-[acyl-carrier protein] methyl ester esterase
MTAIVLVHGWGYDASVWDAVRARLDPALRVETIDLGFFSTSATVAPAPTFSGPVIAVGHSLGALWWLVQSDIPWHRLLCINGFPRFCEAPDYAPAVPPRVLARMRMQLTRDPAAVLAEFHARCGATDPVRAPDLARLDAGLGWLAAWDGRAMLAARSNDIHALASTDDPIIPRAMSTMSFAVLPAGHLELAAIPGHVLPLANPALCARWIERHAA